MKKFAKADIDTWRARFIERGYPQAQASLDNRVINYFVMPVSLFQGIPNGLFRMTGEPQDGYVIGVSAEVPEVIRPHFALSEHDEFMVYGMNDLNRTLHSEQHMVNLLQAAMIKPMYVENKLRLYDHMLVHAKDNLDKWDFTEEDYQGFVRAAEVLRIEQQRP